MKRQSPRAGITTLAVASVCLWASGCVSTQSGMQPISNPDGSVPMNRPQTGAPNGMPSAQTQPGSIKPSTLGVVRGKNEAVRPMLTASAAPGNEVSTAAYMQAMPAGTPIDPNDSQAPHIVDGQVTNGPPVEYPDAGGAPLPTELRQVSHPPHRVAPPDILKIDALRIVPRGPYRLNPLETVQVTVSDTLPGQPIAGNFIISPDGNLNLGYGYGSVGIGGLSIEQAQDAVRKSLGNVLKSPTVNIAVAQFRTLQQIGGDHLVRPDGTIDLGMYGSVYVAGLTLGQVKCVIEKHLDPYLVNPVITVDVFAYNSRKYYVIVDGGGFGQQIIPLPSTGNETVLDAISNIQGLAPVSSKHRIWVARPSPCDSNCRVVLPVDWNAITQGGSTCTNYQLFPGDRVYVAANRLIQTDNYIGQLLAPIERIFGFALLGSTTVRSFSNSSNGSNSGFLIAR